MTQVKICGITNTEDALAAIEAGAELLGFNFYRKSPRCVSPEDARRMVEQLPEHVKGVGVFVNEDAEGVARIASDAGIATVQLHGDESPELCATLRDLSIIKALRVGKDFRIEDVAKFETDAVLLDAYVKDFRGGTGHTFDWSIARRTRDVVRRLVLAGGLTPENVAAAVKYVRPYAVDVCSGVETAPGRKSFHLMQRFVEAVREVEVED
ncbi:MAG: phosphoribosylanthranilate isomerase [Rubrivivax sp.]|nr:phosphoribosylanthranilate isomerase [Pyrinomonadaceae bacterium]